jgi:tRNA 2-thiouridine synthesizing protein A
MEKPAPIEDGAGLGPAASDDDAERVPARTEDDAGLVPVSELDCRGLYCPLPVLRTERALAGLAVGETLRVVATDPVAELDMAVLCQRAGHHLVRLERRDEELVFLLRRGAAGDGVG